MENEIATLVKIRFSDCDPLGHLNNVKYLEYMLNAREDHVQQFFNFDYHEHTKNTGCTWITVQNEIAYLKEVKFGKTVKISSKIIEIQDRTSKVELIMTNEDSSKIYAILWITAIYFNVITRKSEIQPKEIQQQFNKNLQNINQKSFEERVLFFRSKNKLNNE